VDGLDPVVSQLAHCHQVLDAGDLAALGREHGDLSRRDVEVAQFLQDVDDQVGFLAVDPRVAHRIFLALVLVDESDGLLAGDDAQLLEVHRVGLVLHFVALKYFVRHFEDGRVHALLVGQFELDALEGFQPLDHAFGSLQFQVVVEHWRQLPRVPNQDEFLAALENWNQHVEVFDLGGFVDDHLLELHLTQPLVG